MLFKRIYTIPVALALLGFGLFQQSANPSTYSHEYLGFSLMPGANSSPVTYHIICKYDDPAIPTSDENISEREFISIAYGWGESAANPNHENFFDKYQIAHCGYVPDTIIHYILYKGGLGCDPLEDLWKLAHSEWTYGSPAPIGNQPQQKQNVSDPATPGPGWARDPNHPSDGQLNILQQYGAQTYIDIIYGENAFHLLHDMQDPTWVARYQSS